VPARIFAAILAEIVQKEHDSACRKEGGAIVLINCVAYENGTRLADLPVEEISDYLERPDCFVWVALCDPTPQELDQMQEEFKLHELAVEDAHHGHQRPKIEEYGDSVFAVMHQMELINGEFSVSEVNVFVGRNYVLSVRNHSKQHFLAVRERCEREPQLLQHGSGFVFYALMDAVVDRYFPIMDRLESELDGIEEQIFAKGAARTNIERLYDLKRKITLLKHAVAPLMEAAGKLSGGRGPAVCANSRDYFRDVYDHLTRINASIDNIRDTIGTAIQVNLSMVTIEESEVNKKLAAWAGVFAVATAFAGIWGMNFKAMPELQWDYGYPVALLTIGAACTFLYYRFKRAGWL
jgi:magnesium transporter